MKCRPWVTSIHMPLSSIQLFVKNCKMDFTSYVIWDNFCNTTTYLFWLVWVLYHSIISELWGGTNSYVTKSWKTSYVHMVFLKFTFHAYQLLFQKLNQGDGWLKFQIRSVLCNWLQSPPCMHLPVFWEMPFWKIQQLEKSNLTETLAVFV